MLWTHRGCGPPRDQHLPAPQRCLRPKHFYEAAPEDLFAAQRQMRDRGEELLAIYHSHPRSAEPVPSETDVRLAFYPQAVYFIIGLGGPQPVARAVFPNARSVGKRLSM